MATGKRTDPLAGYHFWVEIRGKLVGAFRECAGLGSENEVVEYKAADEKGKEIIYKIPGRLKWDNITLKRGVTDSMDLWKWRKEVEDGSVDKARTNGTIFLYSQDNTMVGQWDFKDGWPTKVSGPSLNAQNNEVAVEELVIAHEEIKRIK